MGFKKEVREFIDEMREAFVEQRVMIDTQRSYINQLLKQNTELHDRLMSRNYPEFRTYDTPVVQFSKPDYDFREDDELTGKIVDPEEYNSDTTEK